jgi:hypothetical protein
MAARKPKAAIGETGPEILTPTTPAVIAPLAELDPVDGRPVFAEGLSRRRWLEAHADERKAAQLAELLADPGESDDLGGS